MKKVGRRSIKSVISKISRDLKPGSSSWIGDSYEWIGEAIGKIGVYEQYGIFHTDFTVENNRLRFPCCIDNFIGILYNGCKLPINKNITAVTDITKFNDYNIAQNVAYHAGHYYTYNEGDYLKFSFEEGTVTIYYFGLPLDCDGLPMIPDDDDYAEALMFYVLNRMILGGYKHPLPEMTFQTTLELFEHYMCRASNNLSIESIDDAEDFMNKWLDPTYTADLALRFYGLDYAGSNANPPGTPIDNPYGIQ